MTPKGQALHEIPTKWVISTLLALALSVAFCIVAVLRRDAGIAVWGAFTAAIGMLEFRAAWLEARIKRLEEGRS